MHLKPVWPMSKLCILETHIYSIGIELRCCVL